MNATLHQEASRLESKLSSLYSAYSPYTAAPTTTTPPLPPNPSCKFQYIFYDPMTPAQRLQKTALAPSSSHNYPPQPPHVDNAIWIKALAQTPDPDQYLPVVITSAEGLHSRLVAQQSAIDLHATYPEQLDEGVEGLCRAIQANRVSVTQ